MKKMFTLIELLVVIAMIAIIGGIIWNNFVGGSSDQYETYEKVESY